jgi:hypothetical protein
VLVLVPVPVLVPVLVPAVAAAGVWLQQQQQHLNCMLKQLP